VRKTVVIDCFPESVSRYRDGYAIVAVDVVRATTTAISAAVCGHRCFPVATVEAALELAASLENALLAGEERGIMPLGFDLNNSPTELLARIDFERPVILVSSSGTKLCHQASKCDTAFLACFRNYRSIAGHLAKNFPKVAVIGAGSLGEFREAPGQGKMIGVLGCVAQQEGEKIFHRSPWVNLVCGSASYSKLPELLSQLEAGEKRVTGHAGAVRSLCV